MSQDSGPAIDLFADYDAAYVLGALSPADRRDFEAHLVQCQNCTAAVGELAGLPGLLTAVPVEAVLDGPIENPPDTSLPKLLRRVRRGNRRRWAITAGSAVAAAAAAVAIVLVIGIGGHGTPRPDAAPSVALTAVQPSALRASVALIAQPWGTRIDLNCSYDADDGYGSHIYLLTITARDGSSRQIGSWTAGPGSTAAPTGSTDLPLSQIAAVDVRTESGTVLLQLQP